MNIVIILNYSIVNKYNKFGFFEFYDILKYHLAIPKYKLGDIVLVNILDTKPLNFAICCYALEDKINKIESN